MAERGVGRRSTLVWSHVSFCAGLTLLLLGCAGNLRLQKASLQPLPSPGPTYVLVAEANGDPEDGSSRPLPVGTRLQQIATIPQGAVLRPLNREIQITAGDRYEAYIVAAGTVWNGYYLPYEQAILPLKQNIELKWTTP